MKAILIPVKEFARAKQRLSSILTQTERATLAETMLQDVADAVDRSRTEHVILLSSDPAALRFGRTRNWEILPERQQHSESQSVDTASTHLRSKGITHLLRLPADIPLVQPSDVDDVFDHSAVDPCAVVVPSRDETGTNALLRTPPDLFRSHFGPNSLELHKAEASRARISIRVVSNRRISLDLDEPEDLRCFLQEAVASHTLDFLNHIRVSARLTATTSK